MAGLEQTATRALPGCRGPWLAKVFWKAVPVFPGFLRQSGPWVVSVGAGEQRGAGQEPGLCPWPSSPA